jgi:hypothetical protein
MAPRRAPPLWTELGSHPVPARASRIRLIRMAHADHRR